MKQFFLRFFAVLIACVLIAVVSVSAFAETIYEYYGLQYTIINNYSVSVYGRISSSDELVVPDSINGRTVVDIANYAFQNDTQLTTINLNRSVGLERIGMFAFMGCENLSGSLTLPESINKLETAAFQGCSSLTDVDVRVSATELPSQIFYQCTSLTTAWLSDSIQSIGGYAFAGCPNLTYLELSRNVTSIAKSAFRDDPNLTLGVWYDSYAYTYAKEQGIPYVLLDGALLGDATGDSRVNIQDVTAVQRHAAELQTLTGIWLHAGDANQDAVTDVSDATVLQAYLAEYAVDYPVAEVMTQ